DYEVKSLKSHFKPIYCLPSSAAVVIFPLQRTRYNSQDAATVDLTIFLLVHYDGPSTGLTVSLQRLFYEVFALETVELGQDGDWNFSKPRVGQLFYSPPSSLCSTGRQEDDSDGLGGDEAGLVVMQELGGFPGFP
ncbi:hypothetical protein HAX54_016439, partial [Datura stramonium]|nr:hypothetical protein [Datura stramonium]